MIDITFRRSEDFNDFIHHLQLYYLYIIIFSSIPSLLDIMKPLSFFLPNLAHVFQHLPRSLFDSYILNLFHVSNIIYTFSSAKIQITFFTSKFFLCFSFAQVSLPQEECSCYSLVLRARSQGKGCSGGIQDAVFTCPKVFLFIISVLFVQFVVKYLSVLSVVKRSAKSARSA